MAWSVRFLALAGGFALVTFLILPGSSTRGTATQPLPEGTPQGFGYVLDALTGTAIQGIPVVVDGQISVSDPTGRYELSDLTLGPKTAVVDAPGYAPNLVHFSVHQDESGSTSVHLLPLYLLALAPSSLLPAGGGVVSDGAHQLSFDTGGLTVSITAFGEHPGTPAPPELIPTPTSPQSPRLPIVGTASGTQQAFPQSVFYADMPAGITASVQVPLGVQGADPAGTLLPLLRFDPDQAHWERAGDLKIRASGLAAGTVSGRGLYMVVTVGVITRDSVQLTGSSTSQEAPFTTGGNLSLTLTTTFEIGPGTSSDVRAAAFWLYGRREGADNLLGVRVLNVTTDGSDSSSDFFKTGLVGEVEPTGTEPTGATGATGPTGPTGPAYCPSGIFPCPSGSTPCYIAPRTVNGCGTVTINGDCACCPEGTACGGQVTIGQVEDSYDIAIGIDMILRLLESRAEKRKEDVRLDAVCASLSKSN